MPQSNTLKLRTLLFSIFLTQLEENQELISQYGETFEDACGSLNYATAIRYEMLNAEQNERFKKLIPSGHTLLRWFQRGNFTARVQSRSVTSIARFLGYANFDEFQKSEVAQALSISFDKVEVEDKIEKATEADVKKKIELEPKSEPAEKVKILVPSSSHQYSISTSVLENSNKRRSLLRDALIAVTVSLMTFMFLEWRGSTKSVVTTITEIEIKAPSQEELHQLIEEAIAFEYGVYSQVGRKPIDTSGHYHLFTSDSPAWKAAEKVIAGSLENKYTLDLERSARSLITVELKHISESTIVLESIEACNLIWNSKEGHDMVYDEVNEHVYTLKKELNNWKIHHNGREGKYF